MVKKQNSKIVHAEQYQPSENYLPNKPKFKVDLLSKGDELEIDDLVAYTKYRISKTSHIYIALDSDVFRSISWAQSILLNGGSLDDDRTKNDPFISKNKEQIKDLLQLSKIDKVRFLITRTVYHENKHLLKNKSNPMYLFAKNFCYFPDVSSKEYRNDIGRARVLAQTYCEQTNNMPSPMKSTYSEYDGTYVPENDAYIVAQATVAGCYCLLTNNKKDYLFNEKTDSECEKSRKNAIIQINKKMGYGSYSDDGRIFLTTKPTTISALMNTLQKHQDLEAYLEAPDSKFKLANETDFTRI